MSIKANVKITTRDKKGKLIEYPKGSVITDFDEAEEKRLIENDSAEAVETVNVAPGTNTGEQNQGDQQSGTGPGPGPSTGYPGA